MTEPNLQAITLKIVDHEHNEVAMDEKFGNVFFTAMHNIEEDGITFAGGMVGAFSTESIHQALGSLIDVAVEAIREHHIENFGAEDYLDFMMDVVREGFQRNFSTEEQMESIKNSLKGMHDNL